LTVTLRREYFSGVACRWGAILVAIVPLAFAAVSSATTVVPAFNTAYGPITSLTPSDLTVQANAQIPTSCMRTSASPTVARFKVGDQVTIACEYGALASIAKGHGFRLGPVISIPGLTERFGDALPVPGPRPTQERCAAAWNKHAPLASRQAIGALTPLAVFVGAGTTDASAPPPSSHIASGPTCNISFYLPGWRTAEVSSVWKHGAAQDWSGFVHGGYGHLLIIQPSFSVSANGTLSSAH
jgi:hypothetical protein